MHEKRNITEDCEERQLFKDETYYGYTNKYTLIWDETLERCKMWDNSVRIPIYIP